MLKTVNKINKNSYRGVKETHLDGECVTEIQMDETLESTDLFRDCSIRIDKTSHDDLGNLANEL